MDTPFLTLAEMFDETDTLMLTAHFPSPSVGYVLPHGDRPFDFTYR